MKLGIRGFLALMKSCRTHHYEVKCRKALCLQAREALWSNCRRTQSSESSFFLCEKYEIWPPLITLLVPYPVLLAYLGIF